MALVSPRSACEDKMGAAALKKTKGRSYLCRFLFSVFVIIASEASLFGVSAFAEDYPDRPSNPLEADVKPAIGHIAGVTLSIPHQYMPRGVHYKGEELWKPHKTPSPPRTFDSEIEDFGLLLRQSNYQPVKTLQDRKEYLSFNPITRHSPENRWLVMDVGYPEIYISNEGSFQLVVNGYMEKPVSKAGSGPFVLQEGEVYGLKRAVSQKPESEQSMGEVDEVFFDATMWETLITCSNYHQQVPPHAPRSSCEHTFIVPEIKSIARVIFVKDDLSKWSERAREIRRVIQSFIVK